MPPRRPRRPYPATPRAGRRRPRPQQLRTLLPAAATPPRRPRPPSPARSSDAPAPATPTLSCDATTRFNRAAAAVERNSRCPEPLPRPSPPARSPSFLPSFAGGQRTKLLLPFTRRRVLPDSLAIKVNFPWAHLQAPFKTVCSSSPTSPDAIGDGRCYHQFLASRELTVSGARMLSKFFISPIVVGSSWIYVSVECPATIDSYASGDTICYLEIPTLSSIV